MRWGILIACIIAVSRGSFSRGFNRFADNDKGIYTNTEDDVIGKTIQESDNPLRDGSYQIGEDLDGVYNDELTDTKTSWDKTSRYIKGIVNRFLGVVGLIALIYVIYHGIITLTAGANEEKQKKGLQGVRYGAIALIGLGVAWFILSLIFWLIGLVANAA